MMAGIVINEKYFKRMTLAIVLRYFFIIVINLPHGHTTIHKNVCLQTNTTFKNRRTVARVRHVKNFKKRSLAIYN